MKKVIFILTIFFGLPILNLSALEINNAPKNFVNGEVYTLELIATPKSAENALKINLVISGGVIENFTIFNSGKWLTITKDCNNGQINTASSLCLTLVRTEKIPDKQSLGFLKVLVQDKDKFSIYKVTGTGYSNSTDIREDLGELLEVTPTQTIATSSTQISNPLDDPIILYALVGAGLALIVFIAALIFYIVRRK